jgi:Skp family chaperone for outer membrane proteins
MTMRVMAILWVALAVTPAWAQPEGPRVQLRLRVRQAIVQRLVERLALDAPTAARLAQVANNYDDQIAAVQAENQKARRELKQLTDGGKGDDATVNRLADRVLANRARVRQLEDGRLAEMRKVLRPNDYGRLIIIWPQVNQQIRGELMRALQPGARGGDEE